MLKFILKRMVLMFIVILGVTMLTFLIMHLTPGDPAEMIALARQGAESLTPENIERIRVEEGLDAPVHIQYIKWLQHLLQGDLGCSLINGEPVLSEILNRFPATLKLALASMFVALIIAIPLGIITASKQYSLFDNLSMMGAMVGVSMPSFWFALLLIHLFALHLGWFPVYGSGSFEHMILPALTLGTGMAAVLTRFTRSNMLDALRQDYIRTARSKGLTEKLITVKHALKNALIPVITVIGIQFGRVLEGSVIVETIFAWPGIGKLLVDSIYSRDFAMIQGGVLFVAVIFVLVNLFVDISYTCLDPRIRYEESR
ncbi:Dipeptide transport system permease protein DppB [Methanosarcina siciliae HI350]|uniref:Dipeptide transport system permease protein DppB n=1 Tax=Methanosarcina siciliae HI350 TaxID=1434119 RepID=A0A0E3PB45_9EURY|nr:Dipeptide transport system permease protein DppB [Methanosarcina siciliae HI350]